MLAEDYERFEGVIRELEGIYSKTIDDETMKSWWGALRDLPFEQVRERVKAHIRYGKHFPRPSEIRPKGDAPQKERDPTFEPNQRQSDKHLDELWGKDRAEWLRCVKDKVYEQGRARGMPDGLIAERLANYTPCAGRPTN